jgi:hypothetical protein
VSTATTRGTQTRIGASGFGREHASSRAPADARIRGNAQARASAQDHRQRPLDSRVSGGQVATPPSCGWLVLSTVVLATPSESHLAVRAVVLLVAMSEGRAAADRGALCLGEGRPVPVDRGVRIAGFAATELRTPYMRRRRAPRRSGSALHRAGLRLRGGGSPMRPWRPGAAGSFRAIAAASRLGRRVTSPSRVPASAAMRPPAPDRGIRLSVSRSSGCLYVAQHGRNMS